MNMISKFELFNISLQRYIETLKYVSFLTNFRYSWPNLAPDPGPYEKCNTFDFSLWGKLLSMWFPQHSIFFLEIWTNFRSQLPGGKFLGRIDDFKIDIINMVATARPTKNRGDILEFVSSIDVNNFQRWRSIVVVIVWQAATKINST